MSSEEQEKQQRSLKELILLYQSKLQSSRSQSSQVTEESLDSLLKFQNALRQTSVLYNAICNSDPKQLCALLLSGNISSMSKVKKPYFTRAFSNQSFVNQSTYLIAFLRENLHFTANLFFKAIDENVVDAKFLSFSTIPTLFQNGWCVEEDLLWSTFLTCYLRLMEQKAFDDPNSPLFYPFKAFFIQKLSLDYLQLALAPDLQSFVDDKDITSLRVNFEFDAVNMIPKLYVNRIHQSAKSIISKLNFYENRIPLSIRRLLAHISSSQIKINSVFYRDINLANFFFINCCLLPVLSEPYMIGLDTTVTPQFVFDDLRNLFFYSNLTRFKPPSCFTLTKILNFEEYQTSKLVDSLIKSANLEPISEFHESLFQLISDRYQKTITFMPLDLYFIHVAFVKFSNSFNGILDENGTKSLRSFSFLMNITPEVNQEQQYNMFTQQIKTLAPPNPSFVPKKLNSMEKCYKIAFSNLSVFLFDTVGEEKAMEFELQKAKLRRPSETEFIVALEITLKSYHSDPSQIKDFLNTQIETLDKVRKANEEISADIKLTSNEIQSLYKRTLFLCTKLASVAIRMLINYLIRYYFLPSVAYIDTHKIKYALSSKDFYSIYNNILRSSAKIIQKTVKCDKVDPDMSKASIVKFNNILYFTLLDRISINSFIEARSDQSQIIGEIISQMKWDSDPRVQEALAAANSMTKTSHLNILMRGVELLIGAVNSSSISMAVHLILQAISTVLTTIEGNPEIVKLGCVIWVVLHSNIEMLFYIYKFIAHFHGGSIQLVDICGNENPKYWKFFAYAIDLLTKDRPQSRRNSGQQKQQDKHAHHQQKQPLTDQQKAQLQQKQQQQIRQKQSQAQQGQQKQQQPPKQQQQQQTQQKQQQMNQQKQPQTQQAQQKQQQSPKQQQQTQQKQQQMNQQKQPQTQQQQQKQQQLNQQKQPQQNQTKNQKPQNVQKQSQAQHQQNQQQVQQTQNRPQHQKQRPSQMQQQPGTQHESPVRKQITDGQHQKRPVHQQTQQNPEGQKQHRQIGEMAEQKQRQKPEKKQQQQLQDHQEQNQHEQQEKQQNNLEQNQQQPNQQGQQQESQEQQQDQKDKEHENQEQEQQNQEQLQQDHQEHEKENENQVQEQQNQEQEQKDDHQEHENQEQEQQNQEQEQKDDHLEHENQEQEQQNQEQEQKVDHQEHENQDQQEQQNQEQDQKVDHQEHENQDQQEQQNQEQDQKVDHQEHENQDQQEQQNQEQEQKVDHQEHEKEHENQEQEQYNQEQEQKDDHQEHENQEQEQQNQEQEQKDNHLEHENQEQEQQNQEQEQKVDHQEHENQDQQEQQNQEQEQKVDHQEHEKEHENQEQEQYNQEQEQKDDHQENENQDQQEQQNQEQEQKDDHQEHEKEHENQEQEQDHQEQNLDQQNHQEQNPEE